jgi:hypothetical protein
MYERIYTLCCMFVSPESLGRSVLMKSGKPDVEHIKETDSKVAEDPCGSLF